MKQRKPTKEESDAMDNYGKPLKPLPELPSDAMDKKKKGGMTKAQKKVGSVMKEFKAGKLHSGKKGPVVKNPKQAIAIALSEAGKSKKMMGGMMSDGISNKGSGIEMKSKGGMVRGQGIALRGTRFKGIF